MDEYSNLFFPEDHAFSDIIGRYDTNLHSLHGKHNKTVKFVQSLSFDLQQLFPEKRLDFIDLLNDIKEQKKEEVKFSKEKDTVITGTSQSGSTNNTEKQSFYRYK